MKLYSLFTKSWFDYIYIYYTLSVILSWTLLNGECIITYLIKIKNDNNYIPGKNVLKSDDMYFIPIPNNYIDFILQFSTIIWCYGLYKVFIRNKYPTFLPILIGISILSYKLLMHCCINHHNNMMFHYYQKIISYTMIIEYLLTIYFTK
jgi:hypothetical protein